MPPPPRRATSRYSPVRPRSPNPGEIPIGSPAPSFSIAAARLPPAHVNGPRIIGRYEESYGAGSTVP
ncbi:hypothetical protein Saa2_07048 [Streptomyces acidiscabies]|nr:hypothetical protein Saa2_07048 [Streptomyces acidiscabies]